MIEKTRRIVGYGSAPSNITSIVAQFFIKCDVLAFKLKSLQFYEIVDNNPSGMDWNAISQRLNTKYRSLESQNPWSSKATNNKANTNELSSLHVKVKKLTALVGAQAHGYGRKCWTFEGNH